ncbi:hypothetical protein Taro_049774 [Colocasia esculenta]|uniref:Glycosyltransferases n=1 Tax=Colocasia esculenta TaxID=4460 RepID=A0A843XBY1_COLES|nr:hypothetical protein [Colocasia esculenta]
MRMRILAQRVFGAWPVASVSANRKRVALEGPICSSSRLLGWHVPKDDAAGVNPRIDVSGFAFNSSILWDPERWGRPTSLPDISQDSFKFVQEVVLEDESKLKGMPTPDCSRVLMWRLHMPRRSCFFDFSASSPSSSDQNNTGKR